MDDRNSLIGTFIGVLITFAMWKSLWGERVASLSRAHWWRTLLDLIALALRLAFAHLGCGGEVVPPH